MMDRNQILLVGLPLFLLFSDIFNLFSPPPPKPAAHPHHHPKPPSVIQQQPVDSPSQKSNGIGEICFGNTVNIDLCATCSYRGTAATMKTMLETEFPGINVVLERHPPPLPKRLLGKVVQVIQFGAMGITMAGDRIFPRIGYAVPPQWYYTLRANRFGSIATAWLLGNFFQAALQTSGAFEVYCNGQLVFSKLKEKRFPGEDELKDLVGQRIGNSGVVNGLGGSSCS